MLLESGQLCYFPVLQSELARPYSPGLFFSLLVAILILKLVFDEHSKRKQWGLSVFLGLSFAAAMYNHTHYFAFLFVGFLGISSLIFIKRETLLPYIISGIIAILLFLPHLSITLYHTSIEGGLQWLPPPTPRWLLDFLFHAFNSSWLVVIPILIITIYGIYKSKRTDLNRLHFLFGIWFFGTYIVAYTLSIYSTPILKFPVMLFPLPFLIAFVSFFIYKAFTARTVLIAYSLSCLIACSTIFEKRLFSNHHFEVFEELVDPIMEWHQAYTAENFINIMNVSHPNYLNYYAKKKDYFIDLDLDVLYYGDDDLLKQTLEHSDKSFCIIGYSGRNTPPYFFKTALTYFPYIVDYKKHTNSAVFFLSKSLQSNQVELEKKWITAFPFEKEQWTFNNDKFSKILNVYISDSTTIYGPQIMLPVNESYVNNKEYLVFEIDGEVTDDGQVSLVISPESKNGEPINNLKGDPIWIGRDLEGMLNKNGHAYFALSVPKNLHLEDYLKVYIWNRNGKPVKIESIKIFSVKNIWN